MKRTPKEPVHIRQKKLKNGSISLYLDSWHDGSRHYEFLHLYLIPEKTRIDREQNRTTMMQAQRIKTERIMQLQQGVFSTAGRESCDVRAFLSQAVLLVAQTKKAGTAAIYRQLAGHVCRYGDLPMQRVNRLWLCGFLDYLAQQQGNNGRQMAGRTRRMYLNMLHAVLQQAVRDGAMASNPCDRLSANDRPKVEQRQINYLTIDEVRQMAAAPCRMPALKQAFLFACFTGLRYGDLRQLQWQDIQDGCIIKKQQKTGDFVRIPISTNAEKWLPERQAAGELVWQLPQGAPYFRYILREWVQDAGIKKHITFHCSRHTAATLWLTYGVDIYTCSRLLGHSSIAITQVYAQVIDKKKLEAVNSVPDIDAG